MTDGAIDRLKEMVNKPFLYQNEEVVILNYCDGTGDDGTEVEIYLNNGKVLVLRGLLYLNISCTLILS